MGAKAVLLKGGHMASELAEEGRSPVQVGTARQGVVKGRQLA